MTVRVRQFVHVHVWVPDRGDTREAMDVDVDDSGHVLS
jgi:hypothetical protein